MAFSPDTCTIFIYAVTPNLYQLPLPQEQGKRRTTTYLMISVGSLNQYHVKVLFQQTTLSESQRGLSTDVISTFSNFVKVLQRCCRNDILIAIA